VVWARSPDAGGGSTAAAAAGQASQGGQGSPSQGAQQPLTAAGWAQVAATLESQQDYAGAARAYRKALHLDPGSTEARTRLGFDLLRAGRPSAAVPVVRPLTAKKGAARPMALLVLGLAQRSEHDPAAARTLRTFLRVAPNHPAAAQVRRLLHTPG
jgi:cytochrome c-type biogenesis protein CcmH/NrfG